MKFPEIPMGGSELQYFNVEHLIPQNVNLMLNHFQSEFGKVNIHWQHQYFDQPSVQAIKDQRVLKNLDAIVFVSYHQKDLFERFLNVPKERSIVIRNAIWPFEKKSKPKDKMNLIYTSTPFRGLDILVHSYRLLLERKPSWKEFIHLDIFSSMKLYGASHANLEVDYLNLYEECTNTPNVTYHGITTNKGLRPYLENAHILAYPNTWEETSAVSVIEAMAAGCLPVISNIGALPETCSHYAYYYSPISTDMYNKHKRLEHIEQYACELEYCVESYMNAPPVDLLDDMVYTTNKYYSWERRHQEWENFFNNWR